MSCFDSCCCCTNCCGDRNPESPQYEALLSHEADARAALEPIIVSESRLNRSVLFCWFSPVLRQGYRKHLDFECLPLLPSPMRAFACTAAILQGNKVGKKVPTQVSSRDKKAEYRGASGTLSHEEEDMQSWCKSTNSAIKSKGYWALVKLLWKVHYSAFFTLGLLKALTSVAGFGGPIVLGLLVDYIESNPMESISKGVKLVALLALSFIASAWLNTAFNVHAFVTKGKIRGGLTTAVFDRALALPGHAWSDVDLSDAKLTTLIQVDVDRVSNIITSIHDLWTLPLQLIVAFTLLYFRVNIAFLAGVAIIIILIPINTKIATAINSATSEMMKAKDKRVKVLSEAIRSMRGVKMLGLEDSIEALSREQRDLEMKYLSKRKYLDAVCVFLWASTPVIVPFVVFTTTELLGMKLSASKVFTTLALLNMLIFPMNAFSWVINGFIEARVSLRRVAAVLINRDGSRLLLCGQDDCDDQSRDGYAAYSVVTPMTNGISGQEFPLSSVDSIVEPTQSLIPFSNLRASDGTAPAEILVKQGPAGTPPVEQKSGSVLEQVMAVDPQHIEYEPPQESDTLLPVGMKSTESIDKNEYDGKITVAADNITFTSVALQLKYATWSVGGHNSALEEHGSTYHYPANKNTNAVDVDTPSDFTVGPITLSVGRGQLLGIVGGTGSGKSSLLLGLLGELRQVGGDIEGAMVSLKDLHSAGSSINSVIQHSSPQTQSRNIQKKHSNSFGISQVQYSVNDLEIEDKQRSPGASLRASYCPQSPVIHSGSVRDNIVMGQALDVHWYSRVLEGCQLNHDIHAGNWLQGDLHDCGESGSNLSGGQRLRIGIARAIYSMQPAVLLDDPLSALDGSTAEALQSFIRTVVCKEQNRLVIIATHAVQSLRGADKIVVLERGEAVATGKYDDLSEKNLQFQKLMGATALRINKLVDMSEPEETKEGICDTEGVAESAVVLVSATEDDAAEVSAVDRVHAGHISSGVYGTYFRSVGITATIVIILCTLIMQALSNGMSIWYAYWVTHRGNFSTEKFITISGIILGGSVIFTFLRSVLFAFGCLRAARIMYQKLMESILGAEVKFFEVTSIGKIVNRFGKDTFCIDDQLPFMLNIVLAQMVLLLGAFAVICYTDPLVIPVVLAVFIVYFYLQRFYRVSSRVLRRLDSAYQSPLYTVVCDCAANAVCLRSLRPEVVTHFHRELQRALDGALRTSLGVNLASQWLSMRLQLLGALISTCLALSAVLVSKYTSVAVSSSLLGLSLTYSLSVVSNLNGLVGSLTETEQEMVSVERVIEYSDLEREISVAMPYDRDENDFALSCPVMNSPLKTYNGNDRKTCDMSRGSLECTPDSVPEAWRDIDSERGSASSALDTPVSPLLEQGGYSAKAPWNPEDLNQRWPWSSVVEFKNLSLRYSPALPYALKDVNLRIEEGSRVAVIGRTGSGKSSLLRAILRLSDFKGNVLLGGVDSKAVPLSLLRKRLIVLPQDAVLFTDTIRVNLDPRGEYSEAQLMSALLDCGVIETMRRRSDDSSAYGNHQRNESSGNASAGVTSPTRRVSFDKSVLESLTKMEKQKEAQRILDMEIKDAGAELSQGQRQLLSLARSLLRLRAMNEETHSLSHLSRIVIIDEATAAVDAFSEGMLQSVLKNFFGLNVNKESNGPSRARRRSSEESEGDKATDTVEAEMCRRTTVLMICHKVDGIRSLCDYELKMTDGELEYYRDVHNTI